MNDVWWIVLVVLAFHVFEAFHVVRADAVLLLARPFARARVVDVLVRGLPLGTDRAVVLGPLLPGARLVVADPWPVRLTATGAIPGPPHVFAPHVPVGSQAPGDTPAEIPYAELASCERQGPWVLLGRRGRLRLSTRESAGRWVERLRRLSALAPAQRAEAVETILREDLDTETLERRAREVRRALVPVELVGAATFLYFFGLLPLGQLVAGLPALGLLAAWILLVGLTEAVLWRAHARLWPGRRSERWLRALTLPVYPAEALRAASAMQRDALAAYHPLAAVSVLGRAADRDELARRVFLGLENAPAAWTDDTSRRLLEELAGRAGLDVEALSHPPRPIDATSRAFCPVCDGQFVAGIEGPCPECRAVELVPFPSHGP